MTSENDILIVNDLHVSYSQDSGSIFKPKKDIEILKGISFTIKEGEVLGLVGESGCGKTTLFRLLKGEHTPDEGEIHIAGSCKMGFMEQFSCSLWLS